MHLTQVNSHQKVKDEATYLNKLADAAAEEQHQVSGYWRSQKTRHILPNQKVQLYIDGEQYDEDIAEQLN